MTVSVIIPTYNRPECIRENLSRLAALDPRPDQVIVVDASLDRCTEEVVTSFPSVLYLRNKDGRGNTPRSRNLGLMRCTGDVIAFLDDDAFVHEGWAAAMLSSYADPSVAGVAGRALNGIVGEKERGIDQIGKLTRSGYLTGNFAADPKRQVEVDHAIGCNMSLRRSVIAELGGFTDDVRPGPFGLCEETEMFVRARRLGYRFVFNPQACVDHIGAPQPGGRRFSPKYSYYHTRNGLMMLLRNYGWTRITARYFFRSTTEAVVAFTRRSGSALAHFVAGCTGIIVGGLVGTWFMVSRGRDARRSGAQAESIRRQLHGPVPGVKPEVAREQPV